MSGLMRGRIRCSKVSVSVAVADSGQVHHHLKSAAELFKEWGPLLSRTSVRSTSGVLGALKCFKGAGGPHRTPALLADGAVVPCASAFRAVFGSREPPVPTAPGASSREPVARRNWRTSLPRHLGASVIRQTTPTPPAANPPAGRRYIRSRLVRQGRVRWRRMRFLRENVRRTRFCRFR